MRSLQPAESSCPGCLSLSLIDLFGYSRCRVAGLGENCARLSGQAAPLQPLLDLADDIPIAACQ